MTTKKPAFLKQNPDGSVDVTLASAVAISGVSVSVLRVREPTVNDQLIMDATSGSDPEKEVAFFSNLTEQSPEDMRRLTLRNYKRVQASLSLFTD